MWIVKHTTDPRPYLKLLAPGSTHWSDRIEEAYLFGTKDEAENIAVRVSTTYTWAFGKLSVEEFRPFAVKVYDAFERRNKMGSTVKVPGWLRGDPLRGTLYLVQTLNQSTQYATQEDAENAAVTFLGSAPQHIGKAELRRIQGTYSKAGKILHRTKATT
jgi:hypothetical protein